MDWFLYAWDLRDETVDSYISRDTLNSFHTTWSLSVVT